MATPFELAGDLYYHTATNNALNELARQGELKDQRAFELLSQKNRAQLESRNRLGEIQAEEGSKEKFAQAEEERLTHENLKQIAAAAKVANPSYKGIDPAKSDDENIAMAKNAIMDKTVEAAKQNIAARNGMEKDYVDQLKSLGRPAQMAPGELETIVGQKLASDPDFIRSVSPELKAQLANGKLTASEVVNRLITNPVSAMISGGLGLGWNPNKVAQQLAEKAQQYRQTVLDNFHQANVQAVMAKGQFDMNRFNQANEVGNRMISAIDPSRLGEVMQYQTDHPSVNLQSAANAADRSSIYNKDGTQKSIVGDLDKPQTQTQSPPVVTDPNAASSNTSASQTPALTIPMTAAFDDQGRRNATDILFNQAQSDLKTHNSRYSFLDNALANPSNLTPEQARIYAEEHSDMLKKYPKVNQKFIDLQRIKQSLDQSTPQPQLFQPPAAPSGNRWNVPGSLVSPGQQPAAQPQVQQPPPNQPSAMNANPGNAMQLVAHQRRLEQVFGTSDPGKLMAARNLAKSQGATDDQLDQSALAAMNGDPNAISQARQLIAMVQGGNAQAAPQPSYTPMSFGA